jgi:hypothetical protein
LLVQEISDSQEGLRSMYLVSSPDFVRTVYHLV